MSVNTFFSRLADRIFLKFHFTLEAINYQNPWKPDFSKKLIFCETPPPLPSTPCPEFLKNRVFWLFLKIRSFDVSFFNPKSGTLQCYLWFFKSFLSGKYLVVKWYKTNQTAGFFDHQYLWKELVDIKGCSIWG